MTFYAQKKKKVQQWSAFFFFFFLIPDDFLQAHILAYNSRFVIDQVWKWRKKEESWELTDSHDVAIQRGAARRT